MNLELDTTTIIAGVLGFFFLIIAMFKNFGRRNNNQLYIPGTPRPQDDDQEVKLSDPFSASSPSSKSGKDVVSDQKAGSTVPASGDLSSFKQFTPDSSAIADVRVRNDAEYQWE